MDLEGIWGEREVVLCPPPVIITMFLGHNLVDI
jgi:hypothetical protein